VKVIFDEKPKRCGKKKKVPALTVFLQFPLAFFGILVYNIKDLNSASAEIFLEETMNFNFLLTANTDLLSGFMPMILMIGVIVLMYFFIMRPQKKQEKETQNMRDSLQVGDGITTIGGIIGKIISIKGETVMIESGHDRTKIRILRSAVSRVDVKAEDSIG
jgi:preprotein translocase subunit YajC